MQINLGKKLGKHEIKPLYIAKKSISYAAAYGAGVILYSIIQKHLPEGMKLHTRLAVVLGTWAIVNMSKEQITTYTDKTFDETVDLYHKVIQNLKEVGEEMRAAQGA